MGLFVTKANDCLVTIDLVLVLTYILVLGLRTIRLISINVQFLPLQELPVVQTGPIKNVLRLIHYFGTVVYGNVQIVTFNLSALHFLHNVHYLFETLRALPPVLGLVHHPPRQLDGLGPSIPGQ